MGLTKRPLQWGMHTQELWRDGFTVAKVGYGNSPIPSYPGTIKEERQNGLDLLSAYNNTIAIGINPEAVKELLRAAKEANELLGLLCGLRKAVRPTFLSKAIANADLNREENR